MILNYKSPDEPLVFTSKIPKYKCDSLTLLQNVFFSFKAHPNVLFQLTKLLE